MSEIHNWIDKNRIIDTAYSINFNDIGLLMRHLEIRQGYAKEYHNNPNMEAKEQLFEMIEHCNKDIKNILGL